MSGRSVRGPVGCGHRLPNCMGVRTVPGGDVEPGSEGQEEMAAQERMERKERRAPGRTRARAAPRRVEPCPHSLLHVAGTWQARGGHGGRPEKWAESRLRREFSFILKTRGSF